MTANDGFNPYTEWLGLPATETPPHYYQILGLPPFESDLDRIRSAADKAMSRVRSYRPGPRSSEWAELLDGLKQIKKELTEPATKQEYDDLLRAQPWAATLEARRRKATGGNASTFVDPGPAGSSVPNPAESRAAWTPPAPNSTNRAEVEQSPATEDYDRFSTTVEFDPVELSEPAPAVAPNNWEPGTAVIPPTTGTTSSAGGGPLRQSPSQAPDPMAPLVFHPVENQKPAVPATDPMAPFGAVAAGASAAVPAPASPSSGPSWYAAAAATQQTPENVPTSRPSEPAPKIITARRSPQRTAGIAGFAGGLVVGIAGTVLVISISGLGQRSARPVPRELAQAAQPGSGEPGSSAPVTANPASGRTAGPHTPVASEHGSNPPPTPPVSAPPSSASPIGPSDTNVLGRPGGIENEPAMVGEPQAASIPSSLNASSSAAATPPATTTDINSAPTAPSTLPDTPTSSTSPTTPTADAPSPPTPAPAMASPEELRALSDALLAAKGALSRLDFEVADKQLAMAKTLAKSPEHQAMVARLEMLAHYQKEYRAAIQRGMQSLEAGVSFPVSENTIVVVVERRPDAIVIKVAGRNQTYALNDLPLRLGLALADQGLGGSPGAPVVKGAFQFLHPRSTPEHIEEVRKWWEQAAAEGEPIADMIPVLDDDYTALADPPKP